MIRVSHLTFAYGAEKVLDDISFTQEAGRLVCLLGPNGAGKSTLIKCLLGLLKKYDGEILLGGKDIRSLSRRELARIAAYVPQAESPVFNYPVMDTVLMGTAGMLAPYMSPGKEQIGIARQALEQLGIGHLADRGINEISGGERQLVFLARGIAQRAKILIMDEPTASLDYGNQILVLRHIREMAARGYTVFLSTHNPEHALQYATHVLALRDHKILADGAAGEVLTEDLIKELYGLSGDLFEGRPAVTDLWK